jgi:hypothetical protein
MPKTPKKRKKTLENHAHFKQFFAIQKVKKCTKLSKKRKLKSSHKKPKILAQKTF